MRKSYIQKQKEEHQRPVVAVLPIHYPKEILTAMNVLAVELWGPPGEPRSAEAGRIQAYVCALVRNGLAFLASGGADVVDGVLFPHTCDSIQGLATLAPDFGGWGKQVLRFQHPKGEMRKSSRRFVKEELRHLVTQLETLTDAVPDAAALHSALALHREIDALRLELLTQRARVPMDDRALYTLLRRGEFLWPEDHLNELQSAAASLAAAPVQEGLPLMISGYVPEPMGLFETLGEAGAYVVADDYAAVGRRVRREPIARGDDPFDTLADLAFAGPPCSTQTTDPTRRVNYLATMFEKSGAQGLIIHVEKFCEPELFHVPAIKRRFEGMGAPVLILETQLETELSGQSVTRLEAFVEMVGKRRAVA